MINLLKDFLLDDQGATAIEYGLIAGLVSIAAIVSLQSVGSSIRTVFSNVSTSVDAAVVGP